MGRVAFVPRRRVGLAASETEWSATFEPNMNGATASCRRGGPLGFCSERARLHLRLLSNPPGSERRNIDGRPVGLPHFLIELSELSGGDRVIGTGGQRPVERLFGTAHVAVFTLNPRHFDLGAGMQRLRCGPG